MNAFGALDAIITKIKVFFSIIIDKLALPGVSVFPDIGLFTVL
jgi:hypothetical protein